MHWHTRYIYYMRHYPTHSNPNHCVIGCDPVNRRRMCTVSLVTTHTWDYRTNGNLQSKIPSESTSILGCPKFKKLEIPLGYRKVLLQHGSERSFAGEVERSTAKNLPLCGRASLGSRWRVSVTALPPWKEHREARCWPSYLVVEKVMHLAFRAWRCVFKAQDLPPHLIFCFRLSNLSLFPTIHVFSGWAEDRVYSTRIHNPLFFSKQIIL